MPPVPNRPLVVVFDIDGTLLDSTAGHHATLAAALTAMGLDLYAKPVTAYRNYTDSGVLDELLLDRRGSGARAGEIDAFDALTARDYAARIRRAPPPPIAGAPALLTAIAGLADVVPVFATGSLAGMARLKLALLGIDPGRALLATAADGLSKQAIVAHGLRLWQRAAGGNAQADAISIGDGHWDRIAAQALGLPFVGLETGLGRFTDGACLVRPSLEGVTAGDLRSHARPLSL